MLYFLGIYRIQSMYNIPYEHMVKGTLKPGKDINVLMSYPKKTIKLSVRSETITS